MSDYSDRYDTVNLGHREIFIVNVSVAPILIQDRPLSDNYPSVEINVNGRRVSQLSYQRARQLGIFE